MAPTCRRRYDTHESIGSSLLIVRLVRPEMKEEAKAEAEARKCETEAEGEVKNFL